MIGQLVMSRVTLPELGRMHAPEPVNDLHVIRADQVDAQGPALRTSYWPAGVDLRASTHSAATDRSGSARPWAKLIQRDAGGRPTCVRYQPQGPPAADPLILRSSQPRAHHQPSTCARAKDSKLRSSVSRRLPSSAGTHTDLAKPRIIQTTNHFPYASSAHAGAPSPRGRGPSRDWRSAHRRAGAAAGRREHGDRHPLTFAGGEILRVEVEPLSEPSLDQQRP